MTIILLFAVIFSWVAFSYAEEYDHIYTDGYLNGWTFDYETDDWGGDEWFYENDAYISGLIDALFWTNYSHMDSLYPESTYPKRADMADKLRQFYKDNPSRKDRTLVETFLNGCN